MALRTVEARRYVTPLREGGSLPAIVEADDLGTYVLKFRGAGQGEKVLVAEVICAGLARALGLPVPETVLMALDPVLGRNEPDDEIRALIKASAGLNLGFDYLPGALAWDPVQKPLSRELAARILWFDALISNVDRTAKNVNLLLWHRELWLIDHGAALYFHHDGPAGFARARAPFAQLANHVLAAHAEALPEVDAELAGRLPADVVRALVAEVPDDWLPAPAAESREAYVDYLLKRLESPRPFLGHGHG